MRERETETERDRARERQRQREAALAKLKFSSEKKGINNGVVHVLRYIWKHPSKHKVFEAHSVPVNA